MKAFRVTGWEPKEQKEYNLGMVICGTREQAIAKKQNKRTESFILDAYAVCEVFATITGNGKVVWVSVPKES